MVVRSELFWVMTLPVPCGNCGKEFLEGVARLTALEDITCPRCGAVLDLNTDEWAAFRHSIKEFSIGKFSPVAPIKQRT